MKSIIRPPGQLLDAYRGDASGLWFAGDSSRLDQCGFTLIEVLIALVLISVGVLGLLALQIHSLQSSHDAYLTSVANIQAMDLEERIRANRCAVSRYLFSVAENIPGSTSTDCEGSPCGPQELARYDLVQWKENTSTLLPGKPNIKLADDSSTGIYTLTIGWKEPDHGDDTDGSREFIYRFRMNTD